MSFDDLFAAAAAELNLGASAPEPVEPEAQGQPNQDQETGETGELETGEEEVGDDPDQVQETSEPAGEPDDLELDLDSEVTFGGKTGKLGELFVAKPEFTRLLQEKADEVKSAKEELESFQSEADEYFGSRFTRPVEWGAEIATEVAQRVGMDATTFVASLIQHLNRQGQLEDAFVKHFGLDKPEHPVAQRGTAALEADRVAQLERRLEEQESARKQAEEARASEAQLEQTRAAYEESLATVIEANGLEFGTAAELEAFRREVFTFAAQHRLWTDSDGKPSVALAYELLSARKGPAAVKPAPSPKRATPEQKKALSKVASKSAAPAGGPTPPQAKTSDDAFALALAEMKANGSFS